MEKQVYQQAKHQKDVGPFFKPKSVSTFFGASQQQASSTNPTPSINHQGAMDGEHNKDQSFNHAPLVPYQFKKTHTQNKVSHPATDKGTPANTATMKQNSPAILQQSVGLFTHPSSTITKEIDPTQELAEPQQNSSEKQRTSTDDGGETPPNSNNNENNKGNQSSNKEKPNKVQPPSKNPTKDQGKGANPTNQKPAVLQQTKGHQVGHLGVGAGIVADYLRKMSQAKFEQGKQKINHLATNEKRTDPASKKKVQSEKAAVAPAKEGQSRSNTKRTQQVHGKRKPKTNEQKAKRNFKTSLSASLPKKVQEVEHFKSSQRAKNIGKAAIDVIKIDKEKVLDTYEEMGKLPAPEANLPHLPFPGLEQAVPTPTMNLGQNMMVKLKTEHTDFSAYKKRSDDALQQEKITETHLTLVDSGDLFQAKQGRQELAQAANQAPNEAHQAQQEEQNRLDQNLTQEEQQGRQVMEAERNKGLNEARNEQEQAKGSFEEERAAVTSHINGIYEGAKKKVNKKLKKLEKKMYRDFEAGEKKATIEFEDGIDRDMRALKKKRYKGFKGKLRWIRDKILGLSSVGAVKDLMAKARETYVKKIDTLVEKITKHNEEVIAECRETVSDARTQIDEYVDSLPERLRAVGEAAQDKITKKLDKLDEKITKKEEKLREKLAELREKAIQKIDKRIAELNKKMGGLLSKVLDFLLDAALKFLRWALKSVGLNPDPFINAIRGIANAIIEIVKSPVRFLKNLFSAIKGGFKEFGKNMKENLLGSIGGWLGNKLGTGGIEFPQKMDGKGILKMVLSVLGVSWTNIKAMFVKHLGADLVKNIESGIGLVKGLIKDGPSSLKSFGEEKVKAKLEEKVGADKMQEIYKVTDLIKKVREEGMSAVLDFIKDGGLGLKDMALGAIDTIKDTVLDGIKGWITKNLIEKGITKVLSFLIPASGVVSAIVSIYKAVKFFLDNRQQLKQLVSAVLRAVGLVVNGNVAAAALEIKNAIMFAIPLLLDFVIKLLNLGGIVNAIKKVIQKVSGAVQKFADRVVQFLSKIAKSIWDKMKSWMGKLKDLILGNDKEDNPNANNTQNPTLDPNNLSDEQKQALLQEALSKIETTQQKYLENGTITPANAQKVVDEVKASPEGSIFSFLKIKDALFAGANVVYEYFTNVKSEYTGAKLADENANDSYVAQTVNEKAWVKASSGIRIHTTPSTSDPDYLGRKGASAKIYPQGTQVTIIGLPTRGSEGWVKFKANDGQSGWIEAHFLVKLDTSSALDGSTKAYHYIKSGDTLEGVINRYYADYPYSTGDDRRVIAMGIALLNEGSSALSTSAYVNRSWWKDNVIDTDFAAARKLYNSIRLQQDRILRLPTTDYIESQKLEGNIGQRPDWMDAGIEVGQAINGFKMGFDQGIFDSAVGAIKDIIDLVYNIFTGELFKSIIKLYEEIAKVVKAGNIIGALSEIAQAIGSALSSFGQDIVAAWNNPNPYKKWNYIGKLVGAIVFEVVLAIGTAGVGTAIRAAGWFGKIAKYFSNLSKLLSNAARKIPGNTLDKIEDATGKGRKGDNTLPETKKADPSKGEHGDLDETKTAIFLAAKALTEKLDQEDTPTPILLAQLKLIGGTKVRFDKEQIGTNKYKIWMYGSKHLVDADYSLIDLLKQRQKRLEELSIDPQSKKLEPKSISEANSILTAESEGLVKNARRPDLSKGEPNLDFVVQGPSPYKYADVKTPVNRGDLEKQAKSIGKKSMLQKGGTNDVLHVIDLKDIPKELKETFKRNVIEGAGITEGISFIN